MVPSIVASISNAESDTNLDKDIFFINQSIKKFTPTTPESELIARDVANIRIGTQTIYIGTVQVSANNQNPIMRSFDTVDLQNRWTRTDFETTGADGRGVSLLWNGKNLYASFTVDGTQGRPDQDFRRASLSVQPSWLRSYGVGGGANVSVVARIERRTGELLSTAYVSSVLSSGRSNTLLVTQMQTTRGGNLRVTASSFFSPRALSGQALPRQNTGGSPFNYHIEFDATLMQGLSAGSDDF